MHLTPARLGPAALVTACLAFIVLGTSAQAGHADDRRDRGSCREDRSYHRDRDHDHDRHRSRFDVQIRIGSHGHRSSYRDCAPVTYHPPVYHRTYDTGCRCGRPHGYYQSQWVPPTYGFGYDSCGNRVRVLIRPGFYRQVWVETGCPGDHGY